MRGERTSETRLHRLPLAQVWEGSSRNWSVYRGRLFWCCALCAIAVCELIEGLMSEKRTLISKHYHYTVNITIVIIIITIDNNSNADLAC